MTLKKFVFVIAQRAAFWVVFFPTMFLLFLISLTVIFVLTGQVKALADRLGDVIRAVANPNTGFHQIIK